GCLGDSCPGKGRRSDFSATRRVGQRHPILGGSRMSGFIEWLEKLNDHDTKVRAVLRRSLSFDPGAFPAAYPYVEPFLKGEDAFWRRKVHYLVAGLWAQHRSDGTPDGRSLGTACAAYATSKKASDSPERRFIALLDADRDQLPHRL